MTMKGRVACLTLLFVATVVAAGGSAVAEGATTAADEVALAVKALLLNRGVRTAEELQEMSSTAASDTLKVEFVKRGAHPHFDMTALTGAEMRAVDRALDASANGATRDAEEDAAVDAPVDAVTSAPTTTATAAPPASSSPLLAARSGRPTTAAPRGSRFAAAKRAMTARDAERLARHRAPLRHYDGGGGSGGASATSRRGGVRGRISGESLASARIARAIDALKDPSTSAHGIAAQRATLERMGLLRSEIAESFRRVWEERALRSSVTAEAARVAAGAAAEVGNDLYDSSARARVVSPASRLSTSRRAAASSKAEKAKRGATPRGAWDAEAEGEFIKMFTVTFRANTADNSTRSP